MAPAPAEFSSSSHVVSVHRSRTCCERRHGPLEAGVEPGAEMRADVDDDAVGGDRAGGIDGLRHRLDGLVVLRLVGRREVDQIDGVDEDRADVRLLAALAEALEVGRIVLGEAPGARTLREELQRLGAHLRRAVEAALDPASAMSPEKHETYANRRARGEPRARGWRRSSLRTTASAVFVGPASAS